MRRSQSLDDSLLDIMTTSCKENHVSECTSSKSSSLKEFDPYETWSNIFWFHAHISSKQKDMSERSYVIDTKVPILQSLVRIWPL